MQRSSISILQILQQHLQAGTLTVQPASGGGSAARTTTMADISALSGLAVPPVASRTATFAFLPHFAFTDIFIPFYDRVCLK